jgi:hypothetical protein
MVPVGYDWAGFYPGINGGYAWGRSHCDNGVNYRF